MPLIRDYNENKNSDDDDHDDNHDDKWSTAITIIYQIKQNSKFCF